MLTDRHASDIIHLLDRKFDSLQVCMYEGKIGAIHINSLEMSYRAKLRRRKFKSEIMKSISYDPLWKLLIDKKMNKTDLSNAANSSRNTIAKMGKEEFVSFEVILKICNTLDCQIKDVIEI